MRAHQARYLRQSASCLHTSHHATPAHTGSHRSTSDQIGPHRPTPAHTGRHPCATIMHRGESSNLRVVRYAVGEAGHVRGRKRGIARFDLELHAAAPGARTAPARRPHDGRRVDATYGTTRTQGSWSRGRV